MKTETFKAFGETLEITFDGNMWLFSGSQYTTKKNAKKAAIEELIADSGDDIEDVNVDLVIELEDDIVSSQENDGETVTNYPDTVADFDAMCQYLKPLAKKINDKSGQGYSGNEANGFIEFIGPDWQVDVMKVGD